MNKARDNRPHCDVQELHNQIGNLEDRFVELFLGNTNREQLKRIHVQLKVLKAELRLMEDQPV